MTESSVRSPPHCVERALCRRCDYVHREIALVGELSVGLTDPSSFGLNKADIKALEERSAAAIAECVSQK